MFKISCMWVEMISLPEIISCFREYWQLITLIKKSLFLWAQFSLENSISPKVITIIIMIELLNSFSTQTVLWIASRFKEPQVSFFKYLVMFISLSGTDMWKNIVIPCFWIHYLILISESGVIDTDTGSLSSMFVDYIDGARQYLEGENDRDLPILQEIRLHFSGFIQNLISNTPSEPLLLIFFF